MQIDLSNLIKQNEKVAVAVSGGADSVALLYYTLSQAEKYPFKVIAINVEHGIRGQASKSDTEFVIDLCEKLGVELIKYSVDSPLKAKTEKISLEEAARNLRYDCFFDAINSGKCDKVSTAHNLSDNFESVLLNLFRGTGTKGVAGIESNFNDKIIRPFLGVSKEQIEKYVEENDLPFVTDQSNFDDDYTRNYLRLNVTPKIKEIFPEAEKSVYRFSKIARAENDYLEEQAALNLKTFTDRAEIVLPLHDALIPRCAIAAFKHLEVKKDWEKTHIDAIITLKTATNGAKANLIGGVIAIKEYDKIVLYKSNETFTDEKPFKIGKTVFGNSVIDIQVVDKPTDLKCGFYADLEKIPKSAVIRTKRAGDKFTKFGGGSKSLGDYLTDKKIPLRLRDAIPVLADGKDILFIFGIALSDKIKVDQKTEKIIKFTYEENYEQKS